MSKGSSDRSRRVRRNSGQQAERDERDDGTALMRSLESDGLHAPASTSPAMIAEETPLADQSIEEYIREHPESIRELMREQPGLVKSLQAILESDGERARELIVQLIATDLKKKAERKAEKKLDGHDGCLLAVVLLVLPPLSALASRILF